MHVQEEGATGSWKTARLLELSLHYSNAVSGFKLARGWGEDDVVIMMMMKT